MRLHLRLYIDPGAAEIFCNILRKDGVYERLSTYIDTGAAVSLLPNSLLEIIEYRQVREEKIVIAQAGIAQQSFEAIEAIVTLTLEDQFGIATKPFEALFWFADTDQALIGFEGILDRAVLFIDMPNRNGWLEISE